MSNKTSRIFVENRLKINWNKTPICFDNVRFVSKKGAPYISLFLSESDSQRVSFKCVKRMYTLIIEVRVDKNSTTHLADDYCDELIDVFKNCIDGDFSFGNGYTQRIGISEQWYQKNVVINFKLTERD